MRGEQLRFHLKDFSALKHPQKDNEDVILDNVLIIIKLDNCYFHASNKKWGQMDELSI